MEIHERFICNTTTLSNYLIGLKYKLDSEEGRDSKRVRTFKLGKDKVVVDTYNHVTLISKIPGGKEKTEYRGYTVGKDLLTFFSQRNIIKRKDENNL